MKPNVARALVVLLLAGCDSKDDRQPAKEPTTPPAGQAGAATATGAAATGTAGTSLVKPTSVKWRAPEGWEAVASTSAMRIATYRIPKAAGDKEDAELTVIRAGGDVQSNITRWAGQFEGAPAPKTSERTVNGLKVTVVDLEGAFKGMSMPGQGAAEKKEGYAMLAAIVESPKGGDAHFFKLTGPRATVEAARAGFEDLVASLSE
jgi:hypothetical protein